MTNDNKVLTRDEVAEEETWRLEDIFNSDEAWDKEYLKVEEMVNEAEEYKGKLGDGARTLFEALTYRDKLAERLRRLYTYAHLKTDQDTTNSYYQAMDGRIKTLVVKVSTALSYFTPELLSIDEEQLNQTIESHEGLRLYKQEFKELNAERAHILSSEQEALLAQLSEVTGVPAETFSMLNNADLTFGMVKDEDGSEVQLTHGRYSRFLESKDPKVREAAFKEMYSRYGEFKNTFASTLSGNVKAHNVNARIRNYSSAREAALSGNHIPEQVYENLVTTINKNLDSLHRYVALRKKVLQTDTLHMWDMYTPLVEDTEIKYTYEEAKETMLESFHPLGENYKSIVKEGLENRWVDVRENKGKRSGAYSSGSYGTNPYILMNWQDNVSNLFTLAHEFGHSVHSYYSRENQPFIYSGYSIFVAEVASTVNEALLNDHLLKVTTDEDQRIYLLNYWLDGFRATVFRQTMFAEFEQLIHKLDQEGVPLTAEKLTEEYYALNKKYYGEAIVSDEEIGLEWARIPHFYYNYYVYQYATGYSAAVALSKQILEEGQPAVDRYITNFLKAGSSDYPIEVLKKAGVDMTSEQPIEDACRVFEERLHELEQLLARRG
ncbi:MULTISPECIES: oligoendopeptidase F [Sporosarcina]|uniref:oligoendopeptidase F n=1 Tax=Sporosarcina TaxID=1569 RepID=UPI00129AD418|nr:MULTISPECIES: oligoendopeptidase F [Sporosarcina]GKV65994.1 oligoendopeptidase F [Sporosarcina sp. NCCP-2331]GLB56580.1 oligoendopeptidase F [Sporosarcina sp. NCCP-2378]